MIVWYHIITFPTITTCTDGTESNVSILYSEKLYSIYSAIIPHLKNDYYDISSCSNKNLEKRITSIVFTLRLIKTLLTLMLIVLARVI